MCTRFDSEVNSHTSTRKLVTTLVIMSSEHNNVTINIFISYLHVNS